MQNAKTTHTQLFILLIIALTIVIFPRFNRIDRFGIDEYTTKGNPAAVALADAGKYIDHVRYFRGEVDHTALTEPWAYRPLPSYLASLLPFKPLTAINIINFLFLALGAYFLLKTLALMGFSLTTVSIGSFAFVVSFPVFFYGGIGYIDPVLIGMLCIGQYLMLVNKNFLFFCLMFLAALVKDPYIIILPAWFTYQCRKYQSNYLLILLKTVSALIIFIALLYVIRELTPVSSNFFWIPNKQLLEFNLYRPRAWVTWLITFGPIGFIAIWFCLKENFKLFNQPIFFAQSVGLAGALAILIYSYFSVYLDGRYIWIAYPFMIPLACGYWEKLPSKNLNPK